MLPAVCQCVCVCMCVYARVIKTVGNYTVPGGMKILYIVTTSSGAAVGGDVGEQG